MNVYESERVCMSSSSSKRVVEIFTDGGAVGNPGPGGYGAVIRVDGIAREMSAGYRLTTNNRMELMGVITAIEATADVGMDNLTTVTTDSRYVIDGIEKGWAVKWRANGWMRTKREKALNSDLWGKLLDVLDGRDVKFKWVKGHSGHVENERADELVRGASGLPEDMLLEDSGYTGKEVSSMDMLSGEVSRDDVAKDLDVGDEGRKLTHLDSSGEARMVDVNDKAITERRATASCEVLMEGATLDLILSGGIGKGDAISTAKLAGVMAAKRTAELIPMCHNVPISQVEVRIDRLPSGKGLGIAASVRASWRTGVEMEAMTAVSVAALTVYDMCKSAERGIRISNVRLRRKSGGKSGDYVAD